MPMSPKRACRVAGCPELMPCSLHRSGSETHAQRLAATPWRAIYATRRWRRLSARIRERSSVCEACKAAGRTPRPTRHVHHVVPIREGDIRSFFDESLLVALCVGCHSELTRKEQLACR